ncbi:STAS domain-containing protein [Hymenobacter psoromatis]|uniref:STAS domain-containing protein n=1 Tax=Hymenobacter psoromatis TaxID=1484116 RepID=UPI001CC138A1|nr:STAS domain-containing protein [Hymenobacter psoromatis]
MTITSTITDGILYLTLTGDLLGNPDTQPVLAAVSEHLGGAIIYCAVDLSGVCYINSTGISVLVSHLTKFRSRGGELVLINPAEQFKKILALTKLTNIFAIATSGAAARQQLLLAAC